MPTFNQLCSYARKKRKKKVKTPGLEACPQKKAICTRVFTRTPKKPNSAIRKLARIRLSSGTRTFAYIPGIGHNLQEYSTVLVRGGRVKDLPGLKYQCIRGRYDLNGVVHRKTSRSKYGSKRTKH